MVELKGLSSRAKMKDYPVAATPRYVVRAGALFREEVRGIIHHYDTLKFDETQTWANSVFVIYGDLPELVFCKNEIEALAARERLNP